MSALTRKRSSQIVLLIGAVVGVFWLYPKVSRRAVRLEVAAFDARCVDAITIAIHQDGPAIRSLRVIPAEIGPAALYETALHPGEYSVRVRLDCDDGGARDGEPRAFVVEEDVTVYLGRPVSCDCGSNTGYREDDGETEH